MKVLFDTNVVLDLLLDRAPFVENAVRLFDQVESGKITGFLGATTITTLDYLLKKNLPIKEATHAVKQLLQLFEIAPVNRLVLEAALKSNFSDFEDAVLHAAAIHSGAEAIVTRDESGFSKSKLAIYSPEMLLNAFPSR